MQEVDRLVKRLFSKIEMPEGFRGCWDWTGSLSTDGAHGRIRVGKKIKKTHRIMYELVKGEIPEGYVVRHQCHNSKCCNPFHLLLGTQYENVQDSIQAGRHCQYSLSDYDVVEMRNAHWRGESFARLAWDFSVSERYVRKIIAHERRTNVP